MILRYAERNHFGMLRALLISLCERFVMPGYYIHKAYYIHNLIQWSMHFAGGIVQEFRAQ